MHPFGVNAQCFAEILTGKNCLHTMDEYFKGENFNH